MSATAPGGKPAPTSDPDAERASGGERRRLPYRVAFVVTAMLLVGLVATLPFSVASLFDDLVGPAAGRVLPITTVAHESAAPEHANLHLAAIALDELQLLLTLRVSGHFACPVGGCSSAYRILFVSVWPDDADAEGAPPSAAVALPSDGQAFSQTIQLPIRGIPIHYPFDRYQAVIGVVLQRILPDGTSQSLSPDDARGRLFLTIQELLPRQNMEPPTPVAPGELRTSGAPFVYVEGFTIDFERPAYVRVLAVLLVMLVAAAAAYTVFLRPLHDLIVNSGALVLGVWGIRAILTPSNVAFMTAIDLALSLVIIFLLGAISVRARVYVHDLADLDVLRRGRGKRSRRSGED